ncbi:MAG: TIM barrel protein [archaeon]|nr:MAG: TIM barrel protein [archaeon]
MIKLGPVGIGGAKEALDFLEQYKKAGIFCAEIPFNYQVWLKKEDAEKIGKAAKELGIQLSIHAQYWVNLNSEDPKKVEQSMKRILDCCEMGHYVGANYVTFHAAYYQKKTPKQTYDVVKKRIREMQRIIKKNRWNVKLAPETTGKKSQFGSIDELLLLVRETNCFLCIDFAHMEARDQKIDYDKVFRKIKRAKLGTLYCHFSGIEYSEKGERRHVVTPEKNWKKLLPFFKKYKLNANVINESPEPFLDSIKGIRILKSLKL